MSEDAPGYEMMPAGDIVACLTCGGVVAFGMMTVHSAWHEGRWVEAVDVTSDDLLEPVREARMEENASDQGE